MSRHRDYWEEFYSQRAGDLVPAAPSDFAGWCAERVPAGDRVVDLGCGNARDSLWFAGRGYAVTAFDYAAAAIALGRRRADSLGVQVDFAELDLYDPGSVDAVGERLPGVEGGVHVYGRFLLHALEPAGQEAVVMIGASLLRAGGTMLLEFRTGRDRGAAHVFGEHFRSYPDPDEVVGLLERHGASVVDRVEGHGLAAYGEEDPHVARLVAQWSP